VGTCWARESAVACRLLHVPGGWLAAACSCQRMPPAPSCRPLAAFLQPLPATACPALPPLQEENFSEAASNAHKVWAPPGVSSELRAVLEDPAAASITPQASCGSPLRAAWPAAYYTNKIL
jgi:hypothetical protein